MPLLKDLRYGFRTLLQSPVATIVAILALALGIGVNITSFVAVNSLVLHPFPFPNLGRIMTIWESPAKSLNQRDNVSPANFLNLQQQSQCFSHLAGIQSWPVNLTGVKEVTGVQASLVTPEFFQVLGVHAALGSASATSLRSVVVSQRFWHQFLGSSQDAIGKQISLDRQNYTVIGIMPDDFDFPLSNQIWVPLNLTVADENQRSNRSLQIIGLLKPGVSPEQAGAEAQEIGIRLQQQFPATNRDRTLRVLPLLRITNEVTDKFVLILLSAASMVLLLACANVMNLQLARAARREKEIAVRAALGASRFQLARQLASESVLMALAGGVCALFLASWNLQISKAQIPALAYRFAAGLRNMQIDSTVVAYTFGISVLAGILASLPAILRLVRQRGLTDLNEALQRGGRTADSSASFGRNRVQAALIVFEVAMALVLLVGATVMVKAFSGLFTGFYGFETRNLLRLQVTLPATRYALGPPSVNFYDRALDRLRTLPGVQSATIWSEGPEQEIAIEGRPPATPDQLHPEFDSVGADFLRALHTPLLQGRFLAAQDRSATQPVAVLSAAVAKAFWPNSDPLGQRFKPANSQAWVTVVGVVGDIVRDRLTNRPEYLIYVPYTQMPPAEAILMLRTASDPQQLARAAQDEIRALDADLPLYAAKSMDQYLSDQMSGVQASADTMTRYAAVALLLAATGIFGVISFFVAQRTRDIGVHMALGANTRDILKLTVRQTLTPSLIGILIGIGGAYLLTRLMSSALFNFVKLDVGTFILCVTTLLMTAFLASYIPARRATRIDPLIALRDA